MFGCEIKDIATTFKALKYACVLTAEVNDCVFSSRWRVQVNNASIRQKSRHSENGKWNSYCEFQ